MPVHGRAWHAGEQFFHSWFDGDGVGDEEDGLTGSQFDVDQLISNDNEYMYI